MANFLSYYKKHNPNLYSLIVSLLLAVWYNGIAGLLNYYWPVRGPNISIIFLLLPLVVFLTDDGHLDELYQPPGITFPIRASQNQQKINQEINQEQEQEQEQEQNQSQIIRPNTNSVPVIVSSIISPNMYSSSANNNERFMSAMR